MQQQQALRDHVNYSLVEAGLAVAYKLIRECDSAELWTEVVPIVNGKPQNDELQAKYERHLEIMSNRDAVGWYSLGYSAVKLVEMNEVEARKKVGRAELTLRSLAARNYWDIHFERENQRERLRGRV